VFLLTRRAGGYVQADVDTRLAHALSARLGHYHAPAAREAAACLLPPPVLAHVALLTELALLAPAADDTWEIVLATVLAADADDDIDWTVSVDSTVVRSHQHAAGALKEGRPAPARKPITRSDAPAAG
jgi:hypothetical protein